MRVVSTLDPHREALIVEGASLEGLVDREEVGLARTADWPAVLILMALPDPEELERASPEVVLQKAWQLLFHARVRRLVQSILEADPERLADRITRLGRVAFEEARDVLRGDGLIPAESGDAASYAEFAASYSEIRRFANGLLPDHFPAITDPQDVDAALAADVDVDRVFLACQPKGATLPELPAWVSHHHAHEATEPEGTATDVEPSVPAPPAGGQRQGSKPLRYRLMLRRARSAHARGNLVRSAILRARAAAAGEAADRERNLAAARAELQGLAARLRGALSLDERVAERWRRALITLLDRAANGFWSPEARLLYDLQKACQDEDRVVYRVDLIAWAFSFGKVPLRRPLPLMNVVRMANQLHRAARRLAAVRISLDERQELAELLRSAVEESEQVLRRKVRPILFASLSEQGLEPRNTPERVARQKLVEELLDKFVAFGFLNMGDLRDAISRNALKLPDLTGPAEFVRGDQLLRLDRSLASSLDGVYRRGEIYLRALQRLSSLAFATPAGRLITLWLVLPYLGAFVVLEGLQHLIGPLVEWTTEAHLHLMNPLSLLVFGSVAMLAINIPAYRAALLLALRRIGSWIRWGAIEIPARLIRYSFVDLLLNNPITRLLWHSVGWPLMLAVTTWPLWHSFRLPGRGTALGVGGTWLFLSLLLQTRAGRDLQELVGDLLVRGWKHLHSDLLPGLYRLLLETFQGMLEAFDKLLYSVDEWLRYRTGQSEGMLAVKAVLGVGWFLVAYLVRIYVTLLIEPQVNPIKHFPVVTVSHKIMLPLTPTIFTIMVTALSPLGAVLSNFIAGVTLFLLPGFFGFLVWELKENWRLYDSNRSPALGPIVFGSHGESMARMLRPGFHSGTLPKAFARLRRAERRALAGSPGRGVVRQRETLHHVAESIEHFFERNLVGLFRESQALGPLNIRLGGIQIATNRVLAEFHSDMTPGDPLVIAFECRSGWIVAGIDQAGWLDRLTDARRRAMTTLIAGLYKMAGVQLVHEQLRSRIGRRAIPYDFDQEGLVVRPPASGPDPARAVYALDDLSGYEPRVEGTTDEGRLPELDRDRLLYHKRVIRWSDWVEAWEQDRAGQGHPTRFVEGYRLLPTEGGPSRPGKSPIRQG